mgnify:CR=1 FL=1
MVDKLHLTNMLRAKVEYNLDGGLPLDVFPDKIQEIILNLSRYEISMLSMWHPLLYLRWRLPLAIRTKFNIRNEVERPVHLFYMMLNLGPNLG